MIFVDSLYKISRLVSNTDDPHEALEYIIDEIMTVMKAASASIVLVDPDTQMLHIEALRGIPDDSRGLSIKPGEGVTGWVVLHSKPMLVKDVREEHRYIPLKDSIRSELAVPMMEEGRPIGVVNIDSEKVGAFTEEHLKQLTLLTHEATRVVSKLWLIRQLKSKTEQLESLVQSGQTLVANFDVDNLLTGLAREAQQLLESKCSSIYLQDTKNPSILSLRAVVGAADFMEYTEDVNVSESIIGTALRHQRIIEVHDIRRTEENHFIPIIQACGLVSQLCCPLVFKNKVLGVISIYTDRSHRFNNGEKKIFSALANLGALAIQNAFLYKRIFQSEETLRRNDRLTTLGLLSSEIAHEIRNPLTVIRLLLEGLELDFDDDDMRSQDAKIIFEKLGHLEDIVTRVLSFGKNNNGIHATYSIDKLIQDTLHLVRLKLEQSKIGIEYHSAATELFVEGSKGQLQQVILNLLMNAIEAMPEGGHIVMNADLELEGKERLAVIRIRDNGPGIPDDIRERVFESFLTGKKTGSGLGLGIVKRLLKEHHGDIEMEKSGTGGTTMRFWLPAI